MNAFETLVKARQNLVLDSPFFGCMLLKIKFIEKTNIKTCEIDGKHIFYNPDFILSLTFPEVKGILIHEILHVANLHHIRRGNRNPLSWNIAGDLAINGLIENEGYKLPEKRLRETEFDGKSAEMIYSIRKQKEEQEQQEQQEKQGEANKEEQEQEGEGESGEGEEQAEDTDTGGEGENANQGDSSTLQGDIDAGECGGVIDSPEEDTDKDEQETKLDIAQSREIAKRFGKLPGGIERIIKDLLEPKIPWQEILKQFIDTVSNSDYSMVPPNSRDIWRDVYLPSMRNQEIGRIVFAIDTSGSIFSYPDLLSEFGGEISSALSEYQTNATLIYCDDTIQGIEEISSNDLPLTLKAIGGGFTDFRPVFEYVNAMEEQISCLIYLTDMYGDFPNESPDYPVLWISYGGEISPFGEVVKAR